MMKTIANFFAAFIVSGCCTISAIVGPTTTLYGQVVDQDGKPVPFCPLVGDWEHFIQIPWTEYGHSEVIMSDAMGQWEFRRRGISRIFVMVGKDSHQTYFPGYTPGPDDSFKNWIVGGHRDEIHNPCTISVIVDKEAAGRPFTSRRQDLLGDQYKKLRQEHPVPYPELQSVRER